MIKIIGISQKEKDILLYYVVATERKQFFKVTTSHDGFNFNGDTKYVIVTDKNGREEKNFNWKNLKFAKQKDAQYLLYQVNGRQAAINLASSADLIRFTKMGNFPEIGEPSALIPEYRFKNKYVMYFGKTSIKLAFSSNFKKWIPDEKVIVAPREGFFDETGVEVGNVFQDSQHILLLYYSKKKSGDSLHFAVGACLLDRREPQKVLWRSETPLWDQKDYFSSEIISPLGAAIVNEQLILYWLVGEMSVFAVSCPLPGKYPGISEKEFSVLLKKADNNPIIRPNPQNSWESRATFNTAAVYEDGKVHFVYRALGDSDLSVLGYATSTDGVTIDERSKEPIYIPREPFETPGQRRLKSFADHYVSGGGYGGIEDPKLTKIGDRFYMTYVAFNGATPPRVALTSIGVSDFLNRRWDKWESPKLISAPGMVNKSATLFPEKVNGKYVVFHRVYPNILIDYVDDLKFENYLTGHYFIPPRRTHWDSKKVSAGAPPIRTKDGWLLIYHAVGYQDSGRYKVGAMLLDSKDPTKVLYRSRNPIIEPNERYENEGHKAGVVYPCGAVVKDGQLFVYYGGADTVVCVASENLNTFLDQLKYTQEPKVRQVRTPILN